MQKITSFLWFDSEAEEAMNFYVSIFKNSRIVRLSRMGDRIGGGTFEVEGQQFYTLNGGPEFTFTPAISLFVSCESQAEIDDLWEKLSAGGEAQRCGWLKDKFGISWQIIPAVLGKMLYDNKSGNSHKAMEAMLKMDKLDIATLERAYREV